MYEWNLDDPLFNTWLRVRQAWEALERAMEWELEACRTTLPQIDILTILSLSKVPLTPSELANYLFRAQHSTSGLLTRMERVGYIKRVKSERDRRTVEIHIQPKGEALLKQAANGGFRYARRIVRDTLDKEEMEQLDRSLKKLRDAALAEMGLRPCPVPDILDASVLYDKRWGKT